MSIKSYVPVTACVVMAAVGGSSVSPLRETVRPPAQPAGLDAHETHASTSLLGQFRTSFSGWMWVRTDLYLHNGTRMRPLTEGEIARGVTGGSHANEEDNHLHDASATTTVVPPKERDFRGWFGDVEREVTTYRDMKGHEHQSPKQTLPLFRLMTWVDPQFIPGWVTGATVIAWRGDKEDFQKAVNFLEQGSRANPRSPAIYSEIGFMQARRLENLDRAVVAFERAREVGAQQQLDPEDAEGEGLLYAYRWLGLIYRDQGEYNEMESVLREGLEVFPDDPVLSRVLTGFASIGVQVPRERVDGKLVLTDEAKELGTPEADDHYSEH